MDKNSWKYKQVHINKSLQLNQVQKMIQTINNKIKKGKKKLRKNN